MKASEVLAEYAQGERNFQGINLRGQSFRGKDLSGADFSRADIRGTNFKDAVLQGTKFCGAKAGLQKRWAIFLVLISWVLAGFAAIFWAFSGGLVISIFDKSSLENQAGGWAALIFYATFYIILFRKGLGEFFAVAGTVAVAVAVAGTVAGIGAGTVAGIGAGAFAGVFAFTVAGAVVMAVALAVAVAGAFAFTVALAVAVAGASSVAGVLLSAYLGWRAMKGDPRDAFIRNIAIAIAATGGTSFYNADLTDVDFTGTILKSTDLRAKSLIRTRFHNTIKLNQARAGKTILSNPAVRDLLATGQGEGESYINADLRGANLTAANLKNANLKLADLSEATLEYANLDGANLTQVNAIETNFTKASFTGACIEAWNIESSTILDDIDCRYVYLLEYHKLGTDDRERRPSSGEFQEGEFTKLFQELMNTIDLIFRDGVDWKAFVSAFKTVQVENEEVELTIQSIENKGDEVVVVKISVPPNTDKEKIHREFTKNYEILLKAIEEKYKAKLAAKDIEITSYRRENGNLLNIANSLASKPINIPIINQPQNSDMSTLNQTHHGSGDNVGRDKNINTYNSQNLAQAAAEIQQLLDQLSQTYPTNTTSEQMIVAAKAIEEIESNPTLKQRVINAAREGGLAAFEKALDNPVGALITGVIKGWLET